MKPLDSAEFLSRVWPQTLLRNETLELRVIGRSDKSVSRRFLTSQNKFLETAKAFGPGYDIYFAVATRYLEGGKKSDCYRVNTVWVDFDKTEKLPDFKDLPPDIVVNSGAGFHVYWLLKSPLFVRTGRWQEIEAINRGLVKRFSGDKMAVDVSRILRVPGFFNNKYDPPRRVSANALSD